MVVYLCELSIEDRLALQFLIFNNALTLWYGFVFNHFVPVDFPFFNKILFTMGNQKYITEIK